MEENGIFVAVFLATTVGFYFERDAAKKFNLLTALSEEQPVKVRHLKYGDGTVTEIVDDPRDYKVTIQFDGAGQKIMYAAFAKLKKL